MVLDQGRIKPRRRIIRVETFGQIELSGREKIISSVAERLAQVAAQQSALRLQERRRLQVLPARLDIALANAAQPAAQPGVAQGTVDGNGLIKRRHCLGNSVFRGEQESFQRIRLGIARGQLQTSFDCVQGF